MRILYCIVFFASLFVVTACAPDSDYLVDVDYNKVPHRIQDNHYLSTFSRILQLTGADRKLDGEGPYTVLVPTNDALLLDGIGPDQVRTLSPAYLGRMVNQHILDGWYELNKLPFLFSQEITSRSGAPIYVTRWVKDQDTVLAINGVTVRPQYLVASNGLISILDRMLPANVHENVVDYINDEGGLTLFAQALVRSGLDRTLRSMTSCTVFAPSNAAMVAYGYPTVQAVRQADADELAALIRYHVQEDRRFVNDFALVIDTDEVGTFPIDYFSRELNRVISMPTFPANRGTLKARMLDGNTVTFTYTHGKLYVGATHQPGYRFTMIDIAGEEAVVLMQQSDHVARNGFIHLIDKVLKKAR